MSNQKPTLLYATPKPHARWAWLQRQKPESFMEWVGLLSFLAFPAVVLFFFVYCALALLGELLG
jgi:hypothetical protein